MSHYKSITTNILITKHLAIDKTLVVETCLISSFQGYMGVFTHLAEKDYHTSFSYPLNIDILPLVDKLRNGLYPSNSIQPINIFNYSYLKSCRHKCEGPLGVFFDVHAVSLINL